MKTKIRSLSLAGMLVASLAGVTPAAYATTKFGVMFDFTSVYGYDAGGAFLSFDVDPDNLPFDQWIDLGTGTGFEMDAWLTTPERNTLVFTEQDLSPDELTGIVTRVYIENLNPIFPVRIGDPIGNSGFGFSYGVPGEQFRFLNMFADGTGSGYFDSSVGPGSWTVTAAWFDDPIPAVVPVPGAVWLFGSAVAVMGVLRRRVASRTAG